MIIGWFLIEEKAKK